MKFILVKLYYALFTIRPLIVRNSVLQLIAHALKGNSANINVFKQVVTYESLPYKYLEAKRLSLYFNGMKARVNQLFSQYCIPDSFLSGHNVIIDIGANIGEFALGFKAENTHYYAFEPSPKEYELLLHNLSLPGFKKLSCFNLALGNKNGLVKFFVKSDTADNSIDEIGEFETAIQVEVLRLDDLEEIQRINKIDLIKLDAEGFEFEVLEGAVNTLKRTRYVAVDCGFEKGIENQSTLIPVANLLWKNGYVLADFSPQRFTFLFVNEKLIGSQ